MHAQHQLFVDAIGDLRKVTVTFFSQEDGTHLRRACAPMDYGPSRRAHDQSDRYHVWDYESDTGPHSLSLLPAYVVGFELMGENFDPHEFVTWDVKKSPWFLPRDWGDLS